MLQPGFVRSSHGPWHCSGTELMVLETCARTNRPTHTSRITGNYGYDLACLPDLQDLLSSSLLVLGDRFSELDYQGTDTTKKLQAVCRLGGLDSPSLMLMDLRFGEPRMATTCGAVLPSQGTALLSHSRPRSLSGGEHGRRCIMGPDLHRMTRRLYANVVLG
ncbi:hypothetical protein GY45DRAFT_416582 [Cubamyces sp. BRFM 1775]|nr:hypothetical protein GY45DRAFT_416582 [Cubamyces sp. BRFM 1775]